MIGHGKSYRENYTFIKEFDGLLLSVDATTPDLLDHNIIPDYTLYSETQHTVRSNNHIFMPERHFTRPDVYNKITAVYRHNMTPTLVNRCGRFKVKSIIFDAKFGEHEEYTTQAVGLYSIAFADTLNINEIHLIGFDYIGLDNSGNDMTEQWIEETRLYIRRRLNDSKIIDHSGGDFPR